MIPPFNQSGVIPPFLSGLDPTTEAARAPYQTTMSELMARFANSPERATIAEGLLGYRQEMREAGITRGFQWIDGSFTEDCERLRHRPPRDVDIVTFAARPADCSDDVSWQAFVRERGRHLFDIEGVKKSYHCHSIYVDLDLPASMLVRHTVFWFGLFSHQRISYLWKGLLVVPLSADDETPLAVLGGAAHAS